MSVGFGSVLEYRGKWEIWREKSNIYKKVERLMYHCSHFTAGGLRGRCNTNRSLLTLWGELQEAFHTVQPNGHQLVFNLGKARLSLPHSHEQWLSLSLMEKKWVMKSGNHNPACLLQFRRWAPRVWSPAITSFTSSFFLFMGNGVRGRVTARPDCPCPAPVSPPPTHPLTRTPLSPQSQ